MSSINYKKASTYYVIGSFFNKGIAFLTIPIFTRILSTYDYGIVNTYNSWVAIVSMIIGFALHTGIRVAYVDFKEEFDQYTATTISFTVLFSSLFTGLVVLICKAFVVDVSILLVVLCLLQSFSTAVVQDYSYYLMMQYRYKFRTALMIFPNLFSVICSIFVIMFVVRDDLYMGRIIPTALINFLFGILVVVLAFYKGKVLFKVKYLKYGMVVSAPLILHGISLNILSQSDRTMITWLSDASQTGIYSLIYNFGTLATVVTASLEGVWVPWFFQKLKQRDNRTIQSMAENYINLMTCVMGCLVLVAPEMVKILADKNYWQGIAIIPPIVLANYVVFIYTLYVNVEHFYKKTIYITFNTVIAAITNIALNLIFIPKYGYVAAAFTTLAAYIVSFVLHSFYAKKLEPELFPLKTFLKPTLQLVGLTVVFYLFIDYLILRWVIMLAYFIMMLVSEREKIFELFPTIGKKFSKKNRD